MIIYNRMYDKKNINKFYLSPYIEYYINNNTIYLYNFTLNNTIKLYINNAENIILKLIEGISEKDLLQLLLERNHKIELSKKILLLLIQNKIIE